MSATCVSYIEGSTKIPSRCLNHAWEKGSKVNNWTTKQTYNELTRVQTRIFGAHDRFSKQKKMSGSLDPDLCMIIQFLGYLDMR